MNFFKISQMENGTHTYGYFVKCKKVCQKAWLESHGTSNGRYSYIAVEPFVCNKAGNLTVLTILTELCINCLMLVGNESDVKYIHFFHSRLRMLQRS